MGYTSLDGFLAQIANLEIQGATAVARETLRFLEDDPQLADNPEERIKRVRDRVLGIRPTEPMLRNATHLVLARIEKGEAPADALQDAIARIENANEKIAEHGRELFEGDMTVLTHCHSSSATAALIAGSERSDLDMYVTETRPKYQGRTTAKELVEAGIETTMIVDSAVFSVLDEVDMILVGADALTDTHVYNKIGTSQIAYLAHDQDIPFVVAASLLKFTEEEIAIEERSREEVWEDAPDDLCILNPAFDRAPWAHVSGVVTEKGVLDPGALADATAQIK